MRRKTDLGSAHGRIGHEKYSCVRQRKGGSFHMRTPHDEGTRTKAWESVFLNGTPPTDAGIASSGITFHLWRLYQHAWLVCLLFPLVSLGREPFVLWRLALGLLALLFFASSYTWLMWPH